MGTITVKFGSSTTTVQAGESTASAMREANRAVAASATAQALANYRPLIADALALTSVVGEAFTSDESGALLAYRRIAAAPNYERAPELDPVTMARSVVKAANKAEIAALDSSVLPNAVLNGTLWIYDATVTSGRIALDTNQGMNIAPLNGDPGAYVRQSDVIRPEFFGGRDAVSVKACFDYVGGIGGGVIDLYALDYDSPYVPASGDGYFDQPPLMLWDDITLRGERMPRPNSGLTALENGTVWKGSLFYAANNFNYQNLGIDVGSTWCAANNAGAPQEGLISQDRGNAGRDGYTPTGANEDPTRIAGKERRNIIVLCKGTGRPAAYWSGGDAGDVSDVHACLIENEDYGVTDGLETIFGGAGFVLKGSYHTFRNFKPRRHHKYMPLIKSEDYAAANYNCIEVLPIENESGIALSVSDNNGFENGPAVIESATADCIGNTMVIHSRYGSINGFQFAATSATHKIDDNKIIFVGTQRKTRGYPVLNTGTGTVGPNNHIYGLDSVDSFRGVFMQGVVRGLVFHSSRVADSLGYSFTASADAQVEVRSPTSINPLSGNFRASGTGILTVTGGFTADPAKPLSALADTGQIIGLEEIGFEAIPGDDIVVDGDCESTAGWLTNGSTGAVIAGGQDGNCIEVTRSGAPAAYFYQIMPTVAGRAYKVTFYFERTDSDARFFLGTTLGNGTYTGGTFVLLNDVAFAEYIFTFVAQSSATYLTFQGIGAAGTKFKIDEISCIPPAISAKGDAYVGGDVNIANGRLYVEGGALKYKGSGGTITTLGAA